MICGVLDAGDDELSVELEFQLQLATRGFPELLLQLLLGEEWHPPHESYEKKIWSCLSAALRLVHPVSLWPECQSSLHHSLCKHFFLILLQFNMCLKHCVALTAAHSLTDLGRSSVLQTLNPPFDVWAVSCYIKYVSADYCAALLGVLKITAHAERKAHQGGWRFFVNQRESTLKDLYELIFCVSLSL